MTVMATPLLEEILKLSVDERIQLVEDIWDSIAEAAADMPLTSEQIEELDRRMADYRAHPETSESWESVKRQLLGAG
jgi:putative addiction module component (TIGR02574 family)